MMFIYLSICTDNYKMYLFYKQTQTLLINVVDKKVVGRICNIIFTVCSW